jgi:hypothetical protein
MNGQKLLVRGALMRGAIMRGEIWRGMLILDRDSLVAGTVAAVVLDAASQTVSHILLGQLPPTAVYRLIPISLLDHIADERLWLQVAQTHIETLPVHQPDDSEETR